MHSDYVERVVDLIDPALNRIYNMSVEDARARVLSHEAEAVREIDGSFALLARDGKTVRMARSLDRPMRYFLAKRQAGPALIVADRIDAIHEQLKREGLGDQFHPSYTRMVPAHHIIELQLIGCPDPDPTYTRFFNPKRDKLSTDLDEIGRAYIGAVADEIAKWLQRAPGILPGSGAANQGPGKIPGARSIGVCFSGGIDSGAIFLITYHVMRTLGLSPSRLKAFTLSFGDGPDLQQAREFLERIGLGMFLEPIEADLSSIDVRETIRTLEDYKPLDVECASMGLTLCRGIRERYPDWRCLIDGDGGDENLKDYPIEENPELTIRSVVQNTMLYQEGWGVGRIKHSLTYSGGLSRGYVRTYAPARRFGFEGFSPFAQPNVIEVAEGIPFIALTDYSVEKLYALKGEIVSRGVKAITGMDMPVFPKRRFQHGALRVEQLRERVPNRETDFRKQFLAMYQ
ncbi:MAG TPA: asparagine synthase-related protein [Candidatus Limnocylindria bacterium]|nr:asparagine synthase-related protein [Candidatus Limnocylindria bacterium]